MRSLDSGAVLRNGMKVGRGEHGNYIEARMTSESCRALLQTLTLDPSPDTMCVLQGTGWILALNGYVWHVCDSRREVKVRLGVGQPGTVGFSLTFFFISQFFIVTITT